MKKTMDNVEILKSFLREPPDNANGVLERFTSLPNAIYRSGGDDRRFVYIEGNRTDKVLLVAHSDTVAVRYPIMNNDERTIIVEDDVIKVQGGGILGADDRAGCAIVWLLKDLGHSLLIVDGEENHAAGSRWLMNANEDNIAERINKNHQFVVEFDGPRDEISKYYNVATEEFKQYIQEKTGFEEERGIFTDIVILCRDICGVNLSVGYYNHHTPEEYLVINEWERTLNVCRDWLSGKSFERFPL